MRVGFIGAGKVGVSLGKYMAEHQRPPVGYYSRSAESARWAADFTGSLSYGSISSLLAACDVIFVTVSDGAIGAVAGQLEQETIEGKCICHCSGAETSNVFESLRQKGAYAYSIHPLCAVSSKEFGYIALKEASFTVEGDEKYLSKLHKMFQEFGNTIEVIRPEMKVKYHMAAVFASNLVVGLYEEAAKLLEECGLSKEFAQTALIPLFINNAQNVAQKGTVEALTGPIERADIGTVEKHLQAASESTAQIYKALSETLIEIAAEKNPDRDYDRLRCLLKKK